MAAAPPAELPRMESYRTFGEGITNHFMKPYNRKVWGIDPERMSSDWIEGRVLTPSLDEVIEGALRRGRPDMGPNARFGYPLRGGCEMFVAGLADRVKARGGAVTTGPDAREASTRSGSGPPSASRSRRASGPLRDDRLRRRSIPSVPLPDLIAAIDDAPGGRPPGRRTRCRARRSSASTWGSTARR